MHLDAADAGREPRPILAQPTQTKAGSVDEMHCLANLALLVSRQLANEIGKNAAEDLPGPQSIGIRQCRAFRLLGAEMVELRSVAPQSGFNLTQASRPGQLPVNQCDQLAFRRQAADMLCRPGVHPQAVRSGATANASIRCETRYCGAAWRGFLLCLDRRLNVKSQKNPCHAPRPPKLNQTAVGLTRPSTSRSYSNKVKRGWPGQARP